MGLDPDDLGLDLEAKHPTCAACRKQSDGAKLVRAPNDYLCGTHYDEWQRSPEFRAAFRSTGDVKETHRQLGLAFDAFVERLRTTTYAACWAAKEGT